MFSTSYYIYRGPCSKCMAFEPMGQSGEGECRRKSPEWHVFERSKERSGWPFVDAESAAGGCCDFIPADGAKP